MGFLAAYHGTNTRRQDEVSYERADHGASTRRPEVFNEQDRLLRKRKGEVKGFVTSSASQPFSGLLILHPKDP